LIVWQVECLRVRACEDRFLDGLVPLCDAMLIIGVPVRERLSS
jgi:hypothetical protein